MQARSLMVERGLEPVLAGAFLLLAACGGLAESSPAASSEAPAPATAPGGPDGPASQPEPNVPAQSLEQGPVDVPGQPAALPAPAGEGAAPPDSALLLEACNYFGADNIRLRQRDASTATCTEIILSKLDLGSATGPFDRHGWEATDLSLPDGWTVNDMSAYACTPEGEPTSPVSRGRFGRASGSVRFDSDSLGKLRYVQVDLAVSGVAPESSFMPAPPRVPEPSRLVAEQLEVTSSCD